MIFNRNRFDETPRRTRDYRREYQRRRELELQRSLFGKKIETPKDEHIGPKPHSNLITPPDLERESDEQ